MPKIMHPAVAQRVLATGFLQVTQSGAAPAEIDVAAGPDGKLIYTSCAVASSGIEATSGERVRLQAGRPASAADIKAAEAALKSLGIAP